VQIESIELENFRGITKQKIELLPNINVFVGVNGSGKSTVLDAMAISLSWLVARIQKRNARARHIDEESIKNDTDYSLITLTLLENDNNYKWNTLEHRLGYPAKEESYLSELDTLAYVYQEAYQRDTKLPMIAYYPVNRVAKGISIGMQHDAKATLDVYDNALGGKANFQAFFNWFKEQDDILNEQYSSRSKWMKKKKSWIREKVKKVLRILNNGKRDKMYERFHDRFEYDDFILEEPRFLFHELMEAVEYSADTINRETIHEMEHMLHRMGRLFDRVEDNIVDASKYVFKDMRNIIEHIYHIYHSVENTRMITFIWEVLLFAIQLTFWKLSAKSRKEIEIHFIQYNPNKSRFDIDNFIAVVENIILNDSRRVKETLSNHDRELSIVSKTIEKFIPEYKNLRVTRIPKPHMLVEKNGETLNLSQLSDGEKNMIAMIGDIARRLSMANPKMENPLKGEGIILIDEVDLHLHPKWQRVIVSKLVEIFPNCQFMLTTHSPQVLSHVKAEHIFLLNENNEEGMAVTKPTESYGKSSNRLLEDILGVDARPKEIKDELHKLFELIQKLDLREAKDLIDELGEKIEGSDPELVKASVLIKRKEILGK